MRRAPGLLLAGLFALLAQGARAQVLEIGADGTLTTYRGPAVITSEGVRPLGEALPGGSPQASVAAAISISAQRHGLDPALLAAVARQESGFRQDAVSRKGALGVMQLRPGTARDLGVDPRDMPANVEGGAAYLAGLLGRYRGDVATALAAYNAGPGVVARFKGAPPWATTQAYVNSVLAMWAASAPSGGKVGM